MTSSRYSKNAALTPISTTKIVHSDCSAGREQDDSSDCDGNGPSISRGGVQSPFPWKVHDMLENARFDGVDDAVCWLPHGRAFIVHNVDRFVEQVMPMWFSQTKFASFQRQLNLYGFRRLTTGNDKGAYFHEHFLRGQRARVQQMRRQKVKGAKVRGCAQDPEPNFSKLPYMRNTSKICGTRNSHGMHIRVPQVANAESSRGPSTPSLSEEESSEETDVDVLFFEGKPFHYLDRSLVVENYLSSEDTKK